MSVDKYTIFTLKQDAVIRQIIASIKRDISEFYEIITERGLIIDREMVLRLRETDWKTKWDPPPSEQQREYCLAHEIGPAVALLCRIKAETGAIELGKKLRGLHPIPHLCDSTSIRGKYADQSIVNEMIIDLLGVGYLYDGNGNRVGYIPNIIHTVDDERELREHLEVFFGDVERRDLK